MVLRVPQHLIVPIIFVLCAVGSFAIAGRLFDVYVMLAFGILGFFLRQFGYPMAPLVLGIVLGDLLEKNLRRALVLSDGDITPFFTRPISAVFAALIIGTIAWKLFSLHRLRRAAELRDMKLALCNEVLRHLPFEQQCARAAALGYTGLELAPFTLADDPSSLRERDALRLRGVAAEHGLVLCSLHWLLVQPAGLSLSTPDDALHARTVTFLKHLVDFAAACGASVLVHGSPKQRSPWPGQSVADALARAEAGLGNARAACASGGCDVLHRAARTVGNAGAEHAGRSRCAR